MPVILGHFEMLEQECSLLFDNAVKYPVSTGCQVVSFCLYVAR
jgi:hypothetical protein